ncbi:hypothetical protein B0T19DRAFT_476338 [Cercophora scortea]|uniref:F-box domain-containing protein n=1 Tax=Cercophora scortea TaxID=314031 RepID=A0AAE0IDZ5_9PEZI|nr:hypothetical protein B0T19DRAFT_476338 [Cercophora scortea]
MQTNNTPMASRDTRVARQLEDLPLELMEPILAGLELRDIISLSEWAGYRLRAALAISPAWRDIWPASLELQTDLRKLASLRVPVGTRLFDPTGGALDVTPAAYWRRLARTREDHIHPSRALYRFLNSTVAKTFGTITSMVPRWFEDDGMAYTFLLHSTSIGDMLDRENDDELDPSRSSVRRMKKFLDEYAAAQTALNKEKAEQLHSLAELYKTHHSRLKMPLAPQAPRKNAEHIPQQLTITAGHVMRVMDFGRRHQPPTKEGRCRFRYPYASLVPYDWSLHLWLEFMKEHPPPLDMLEPSMRWVVADLVKRLSPALETDQTTAEACLTPPRPSKPIPEHMMQHIQIVSEGINTIRRRDPRDKDDPFAYTYEHSDRYTKTKGVGLARTKVIDGTSTFVSYQAAAWDLFRPRQRALLPPIYKGEMEWLASFVTMVEWIETTYPELASRVKETSVRPASTPMSEIQKKRKEKLALKRRAKRELRVQASITA